MEAYGATVVLSDGALGMKGANELAQKIADETENSFVASQFENKANPLAHYLTTGPELYRDLGGEIDYFVCAVGIAVVGEVFVNKSLCVNGRSLQTEVKCHTFCNGGEVIHVIILNSLEALGYCCLNHSLGTLVNLVCCFRYEI